MTEPSSLRSAATNSTSRSSLLDWDQIGFFVILLLLIVGAIVGYRSANHLAATNQMVAHTYQVLEGLDHVVSTLNHAEADQRGYLLTQDERYILPFESVKDAILTELGRVRELTRDNHDQQENIGQVEQLVSVRLQQITAVIELAKQKDLTQAIAIVREGTGRKTMLQLSDEIANMRSVEMMLLADRSQIANASRQSAILSLLLSSLVGVVLTLGIMYLNHHSQKARRNFLITVMSQREELRTTLNSIGDGVITTDKHGRVSNLNPVAARLTGWKLDEAVGIPLTQVFKIVNETTREPVDNPAIRALEQGIVVGLANHTILIARDGTERCIDDSAAPIRTADGKIVGCVLVFRDVSERRELEHQVADRLSTARLLASIVESSSDAIISKTLDGTIRSWNQGAQQLFGYTPEQTVGQHISMLIPPERLYDEEEFLRKLRIGEAIKHYETVRRRSDGTLIHVSINLSPIMNDAGQVIAASKIARDITERKKAEERLSQLADELSDSSRRKDEFLATLAHELRNPLAPIRNGLQIIKYKIDNQQVVEETRYLIERQVGQLVRLVDDLLDVSRISRGKLEMRKQPIDLAEAIKIAIETCRPVIAESGHTLTVDLPSEAIFVNADLIRLGQIFANLLNNAAKYSERGGKIHLSAARSHDKAVVRVKDTGIGIPSDMLDKIFEMFTQVDRSLEKSQGGLGIGLTLVKRLVELHNGAITVQSAGQGLGSEFTVELPVISTPVSAASDATSSDTPARSSTCRIMVADDNQDAAKTLAIILRFMGHDVRTAHDGLEAVEVATEFRPDVILLDIGMPKLNGYDACRQIREQSWGKTIVIIALTGWGQEEDKRLSEEAGFSHHLVKPVDTTELKQLLAAVKTCK